MPMGLEARRVGHQNGKGRVAQLPSTDALKFRNGVPPRRRSSIGRPREIAQAIHSMVHAHGCFGVQTKGSSGRVTRF